MKTYTLQEINEIYRIKGYLTGERFVYHFMHRYGLSQREAEDYYNIFLQFPIGIHDDNKIKLLDFILPKAMELVNDIQDHNVIRLNYGDKDKYLKKLVYKENGEIKEFVFNYCTPFELFSYAEIIKREIEIIALLDLCDRVYRSNNKSLNVFEGDCYETNDNFWRFRSTAYIAQERGTFKKLLYIKGKGYLNNGEPNIDSEGSYNGNCISMNSYTKICNIYIDASPLKEREEEQQ